MKPGGYALQTGITIQTVNQHIGNTSRLLERSSRTVLQSKLKSAGITETGHSRRQEILNLRIFDMRRTFGIDFEQFGSRFIAFVPRFEVDHSHTVAGIFGLGHQTVAGQRRNGFDLIHRQQGGLNLVQRLFRALQGCSRRGIHIDINHTLILIGNKSGR